MQKVVVRVPSAALRKYLHLGRAGALWNLSSWPGDALARAQDVDASAADAAPGADRTEVGTQRKDAGLGRT